MGLRLIKENALKNMSIHPPNSLIVRVPNWIGDAVMCEPALRDLRDLFPSTQMFILARPAIGQLFQGHPAIDGILEYDWQGAHKGMVGLLALVRLVKSKKFDMAVLFQNAFEAAFIAWGAGIPQRVAYATDGRRYLLTQPVSVPRKGPPHHMQYYQRMVSEAFFCKPVDRQPLLILEPEEEALAARKFSDVFNTPEGMLVGINPGSVYGSAKRWLPERFAEAANRLMADFRQRCSNGNTPRCVIIGGPGEEELGRSVAARLKGEVVMLSGRTTIRELLAVVKRCAIFMTNDTGPMHVAQALGVPVVAIFGSTDSDSTGPIGQAHGVVRSPVRCAPCLLRACPIDHRCMTGVSVEQVLEVASSQLSKARKWCSTPN